MRLDEYLHGGNKTETELAAEVGVSQATINRLRNGARKPRLILAMRIEWATCGVVKVDELDLSSDSNKDFGFLRRMARSGFFAA